jgi:uncharacterized membrane protein YdbT with pleckstrin-like domain
VHPDSGEVVFFHGHPAWLSMLGFYLRGLLLAVLAGVIAGLATWAAAGHVDAGWVVLAVLAVFIAVLSSGLLRRARTTYTITNERLTIELGLLAKSVHQTRLDRVQNVNSRQTLLGRMLGVGNIDFDTAGEAGFDFVFRGVADPHEIVRTVDRALRERPQSYL